MSALVASFSAAMRSIAARSLSHGAYFKETDATEYDAHEANYDSVNSENYTNAEHDSNFSELDHLREQFEADYLHANGGGHEVYDSGHGELSAASK